jgi:hypothetical protein
MSASALAVDHLCDWLERRLAQTPAPLPPPCPGDALACAGWWVRQMQEPCHETRIADYLSRLRYTLSRFLSASQAQRDTLHAAIVEDRVPWRGEPLEAYLQHWEAAVQFRRLGRRGFLAEHARVLRRWAPHALRNQPTGVTSDDAERLP